MNNELPRLNQEFRACTTAVIVAVMSQIREWVAEHKNFEKMTSYIILNRITSPLHATRIEPDNQDHAALPTKHSPSLVYVSRVSGL